MLSKFRSEGPSALLPLELMPVDDYGKRRAQLTDGRFTLWHPCAAGAVNQFAELYRVLLASAREATNPTPPSDVPLPESLARRSRPATYEELSRMVTELVDERDELRADRDAWRQVALHMTNGGR